MVSQRERSGFQIPWQHPQWIGDASPMVWVRPICTVIGPSGLTKNKRFNFHHFFENIMRFQVFEVNL